MTEYALVMDIPNSCAVCATLNLWFLRMSSTCCTISDVLTVVGFPCLSTLVKAVWPSLNSWHHFTMAGHDIACGPYTANISWGISVTCKSFCKQKCTVLRTSILVWISSWFIIFHYLNETATNGSHRTQLSSAQLCFAVLPIVRNNCNLLSECPMYKTE